MGGDDGRVGPIAAITLLSSTRANWYHADQAVRGTCRSPVMKQHWRRRPANIPENQSDTWSAHAVDCAALSCVARGHNETSAPSISASGSDCYLAPRCLAH